MIRRKLINYAQGSCDFRIGDGALEDLSKFAKSLVAVPRSAVLVTRADLAAGPAVAVSRGLADAGFTVRDLSLPAGEDVCTAAYASQLLEFLEGMALTADDLVVAVGDAEVLGVAQFCAGIWCGGTASLLVPTTLDAMVTCATASRGLAVGPSEQMAWLPARPGMTVCDLSFVREASAEENRLGYVQLIASAMMQSRRSWEQLAEKLSDILASDELSLIEAVNDAQTSRLSVVKAPSLSGKSALLYGETTARALRSLLGPEVPWWHLLAEGMRFEARLGVEAGKLDADDMFDQDDLLDEVGAEELPFDVAPEAFIEALRAARFKRSNRFMLAIPQSVGTVRLTVLEEDVLERHARAYVASRAELL